MLILNKVKDENYRLQKLEKFLFLLFSFDDMQTFLLCIKEIFQTEQSARGDDYGKRHKNASLF
jgi:hypothetical protein